MCRDGGIQLGGERVNDEIIPQYSTGCPWHEVTEFAKHCGNLYSHYKAGFLWRMGAIEDQPAWYLDAMSQLNNRVNEHEAEERKRLEEKANSSRMS